MTRADAPERAPVAARTPQLDGLRALAIGLVIVAHLARFPSGRLEDGREALGEVGVSVFFVLSGYLITTLLVRERARTGTIDLWAFTLRRARRIFPAYYVFLGVMAILAARHVVAIPARELLADAVYLRDFFVHSFSWLDHTWSLAVETQFYLLWPPALLLLGDRRGRTLAFACVAADPFVRLATYRFLPGARDLISVTFHTRLDMLMFGCATALVMERGAPAWLLAATRRITAPVALGIVALCVVATALFRGAFQFTLGMTLEGAAISLLLAGILEAPQTPVARVLRAAPVTWLGRVSYSLYLWQQPFLYPLDASLAGRFPLNLALALSVACISYYVVERTFFAPAPVRVVT